MAETYGYDIFGNRRSKSKAGTTTAYLYDNAHQLAEIRSGSDAGPLTGAAVHDADGHMTKLCEVSAGGTITQAAGDCTVSGTGSTTLALVWNALDHLNTATRTGANAVAESYQYDDSGRRISKTSGATTTSYLYDGDAIHAEWSGAVSGNPAAAYVHGANIDAPSACPPHFSDSRHTEFSSRLTARQFPCYPCFIKFALSLRIPVILVSFPNHFRRSRST